MKTLRVVITCGILLMLHSMTAIAQSVQTDYGRSFNLARLRTYGFDEQARMPGDPLAASPMNDRPIHAALNQNCRRMALAQPGSPTFWSHSM